VVCPSRNFDATSSSLPAPIIAKLVTKRILSEHKTCKVVQGVEISEAAQKEGYIPVDPGEPMRQTEGEQHPR